MGADIALLSVWTPFRVTTIDPMEPPEIESGADAVAFQNFIYALSETSGGYFRNAYNENDVMAAMGMSWWGTVLPMLDDDCRLPIDKAKELIAMIEAKPLTKDTLGRHYLEMSSGMYSHRGIDKLKAELKREGHEVHEREFDVRFDDYLRVVNTKRDRLLAILRRSVELDEPLLCSL
jgi:hypothetical protein